MTHYHISYSEDAYRWEWARDIYGDKKVSDMFSMLEVLRSPVSRGWVI